MKGGNVQINWHDNKPVLTLDFHPILGTLATGGADLDIEENNLLLVQMWSIDGAYLISGLVDNSCIIWDVNKGSVHQILDSHCHYVQGMAWVPLVNYVASLSSDKTCRIYVKKPQYVSQHAISKAPLSDDSKFTKNHLFLDETLPSFFRRLAWLPHGSFLLVPAAGFFNLPHCIIFVVATLNSLYIYETESVPPIAIFAGFHYAAITDIAWSPDADCLALSSQDGYRTLIEFENDELGSPIYLTEEKKVMGDEKRSPVHKPQDMVFEAAKNNSLIEKAENVPTEAMAANNLITIDGVKSKAECNQLTEAETKGKEVGGEENESPVEKLDDMVLDSIVAEKIGKSEAERNEGKNELPIISKPTKRCITLMEFDP